MNLFEALNLQGKTIYWCTNLLLQIIKFLGRKKRYILSVGMGKATNSCCQKAHQRMGKCIVLLIDIHIKSLESCFCQTNLSLSKELLMETLAMLYVTITKTDSCTASGRKITSKGLLSPRCEYHDIKSK